MFLYIRKCSLPVICMTAESADVVLPQAQLHQLLQVQLPDQPVQRRALALNVQGHKKMCVFSNLLQSTVHIFSSRLYTYLAVDCTHLLQSTLLIFSSRLYSSFAVDCTRLLQSTVLILSIRLYSSFAVDCTHL